MWRARSLAQYWRIFEVTPEQFLKQVQKSPAPAYLFIGPEGYHREACRKALIASCLPPEDRTDGFVHHDLDSLSLPEVLDDARSMSLFATHRLIWVSGAESVLPRGRAAAAVESDDDDAPVIKGGSALLADYMANPVPGTTVVFDSNRYDFDGDDKTKTERVQKFFSAISNQVEFRPFTLEAARALAQDLIRQAGIKMGTAEAGILVEALGADASRIAAEIEKLSLYAGTERKITPADLARLVPNAQEATIFELVAALGAGNRARSLDLLDSLVREGEYLPLALSFLATQFRLALVAREAGLRTAADIQGHFTRQGVRIWRDRAEQVRQTLQAFSKEKLESALKRIFLADRALRDTRPDDRIVMEELILTLTA
jgi:DNA polymerase III subunit delta